MSILTQVRRGMGSHERTIEGETDVWLTPPSIFYALGIFDLDPCACAEPRPWPTADRHISLPDDGLRADWQGRVWCNPPYGKVTGEWMRRMSLHACGTALIFARTETEAWQKWVWPCADGILFLAGRLQFYLPDGSRARGSNSGAPSALVAYGSDDARILRESGIEGAYVPRLTI